MPLIGRRCACQRGRHAAAGRLCAHSFSHWRADRRAALWWEAARAELSAAAPAPPSAFFAFLEASPADGAAVLATQLQQAATLLPSGAQVHLAWATRVLSRADGYIIAPAQEACLQVFGGLRFASALDRHAISFRLPPAPAAAAPGAPAARRGLAASETLAAGRNWGNCVPTPSPVDLPEHAPPAQDRPDAAGRDGVAPAAPRRRRRRPRRTHGTAPGPGPAAAGPHGDDTDSTLSSVARALDHAAAQRVEVDASKGEASSAAARQAAHPLPRVPRASWVWLDTVELAAEFASPVPTLQGVPGFMLPGARRAWAFALRALCTDDPRTGATQVRAWKLFLLFIRLLVQLLLHWPAKSGKNLQKLFSPTGKRFRGHPSKAPYKAPYKEPYKEDFNEELEKELGKEELCKEVCMELYRELN